MTDENQKQDTQNVQINENEEGCCKREEIEALKEEIKDYEGRWKRALADYQNLERRVGQEKEAIVQFANKILIQKFLGVFDHLEKAQEHLNDKGLVLVIKQFSDLFKEFGVKEIEVLNKEFDPNVAECVDIIEGDEGKVLSVYQKGYLLHDKVLRPAKVTVGKKKEDKEK